MLRTDGNFLGRYPPSNKYFSNSSRWLLSVAALGGCFRLLSLILMGWVCYMDVSNRETLTPLILKSRHPNIEIATPRY